MFHEVKKGAILPTEGRTSLTEKDLSHELKTALTAIMAAVGVLKRKNVGSLKRKRAIHIIEESIMRQKKQIDDFLERREP